MHTQLFAEILAHYQWQLSLYTGIGVLVGTFVVERLALLVPTFKEAAQLNADDLRRKMRRPEYAANQAWNRKWSIVFLAVIFGLIMPFCLTAAPQPWWKMLLDIVVILMVYDFFYYFTHRFVFHGPLLLWMHAVHHRQHNPCRWDSSYIHPLEVAIGLGLYVASTAILSILMGPFHVATIVITWLAFTEINLHNHNLWTADRFPFRYINYVSVMHHNHHRRFTGGNFATISLLYDWMFGTLDNGRERTEAKA